jgi:hypothetical protein
MSAPKVNLQKMPCGKVRLVCCCGWDHDLRRSPGVGEIARALQQHQREGCLPVRQLPRSI